MVCVEFKMQNEHRRGGLVHTHQTDGTQRGRRLLYFTFIFSHLADAFIQSDLQIRKSN